MNNFDIPFSTEDCGMIAQEIFDTKDFVEIPSAEEWLQNSVERTIMKQFGGFTKEEVIEILKEQFPERFI